MEQLHTQFPGDNEAAIFYALALDAAASPTDKTYANQKKAGDILNALYTVEPDHPGIVHYIIHTYDYPGLAQLALPAARKYAHVAPSSAHALHMPSHIFTRLGLWDEAIHSNLQSVAAARCYAEQADIPGHWDEELHGLDYLVYAYLQKGNNKKAEEQVNYVKTITAAYPVNFKIAYAFAAIPSRYVLENKNWKEAAALQVPARNLSWKAFPWQEAIIHFTRLLGAAHTGNIEAARSELTKLNQLQEILQKQKDSYKAEEVDIQKTAGEAWIQFESGDKTKALQMMQLAADMEDSTEKHPVTPGEVIPARELLGAQHYFLIFNINLLMTDNNTSRQNQLKTIALIALVIGAIGSLYFMLNAGGRQKSIILVGLFTVWVLSPFVGLFIASKIDSLWTRIERKFLYWLMLAIAILSLAAYSGIMKAGTKPAFIFLAFPVVSWLSILTFFLNARQHYKK